VVLGDHFAPLVSPAYEAAAAGEPLDFFLAWQAAISFKLQLYFDFSAIRRWRSARPGCSGIQLPLNFTRPTRAQRRRFLATLAHDPDAGSCSATSISRSAAAGGGVAPLPQPADHAVLVRAMAWRGLAFRAVGDRAGRDDGGKPCLAQVLAAINAWWSHATARLVTFFI